MLTEQIKPSLNESVLCWLATASTDGQPNVSPKELFGYHEDEIVIANIASPQTVKNIQENSKVCVSVLEVFKQKGYQIKGSARIIEKTDADFPVVGKQLLEIAGDKYPVKSLIVVTPQSTKEIVAPSYYLFEGVTEESQIQDSYKTYGVKPA